MKRCVQTVKLTKINYIFTVYRDTHIVFLYLKLTHGVYCFICQHYIIVWPGFVTLEHNVQIGTTSADAVRDGVYAWTRAVARERVRIDKGKPCYDVIKSPVRFTYAQLRNVIAPVTWRKPLSGLS